MNIEISFPLKCKKCGEYSDRGVDIKFTLELFIEASRGEEALRQYLERRIDEYIYDHSLWGAKSKNGEYVCQYCSAEE